MTRLNIYAALSPIVMVLVLFSFADPVQALEYLEASNGLGNPQWEGGHTEIEMADVNLDGHIDLISIGDHGSPYIGTQEHGVMVYFNDGSGRNWSVYQNGNFGYGGICVGDVNWDGSPDIGYGMHHDYSSTDFGDQLIEVALGDGTGQNWTPWDDGLASQGEDYGMFSCDFGDVDNDGDLDIAVTSFGYGNPLMVYLNNGDGTWTHSAAVTTGNPDMIVFFGDINKDGILDLATAYQNGSIFFGNGDGTFYNAMYNLPSGSSWGGLLGLSIGDVDNDGGMDIAFVESGDVKVWVFDEISVQWINYTGNLPAGDYSYTHLYDMNADGFCDVAAGGNGSVAVWTGDGAGTWTPAASYVILNDPDCAFEAFRVGGDADHNGYPDIVHLTDEGGAWNSYNRLRFYRETSIPLDPSVVPLFPKGGEVFISGSARFTDWLSAVPATAAYSNVTVELSTDGLAGPWSVIGEDLPNNGRLQWTIPQVTTSTNCYLRYTLDAGGQTVIATTVEPFTILGTGADLDITLEPVNPPIIIPSSGGSFDYVISLTNNESSPIGCGVWIDVTLPGGTTTDPIINVTASAPVGTIERTKTQFVPDYAPAGFYSYNAYVGIYPGSVWDSASFNFEKVVGYQGHSGTSGWYTDFEGFEGETTREIPADYGVVDIYPNPFNPSAVITYQLSVVSHVSLAVYDISGRKVAELINCWREAGMHEATFDGSGLASGMYLYRLETGEFTCSGKMLLVK